MSTIESRLRKIESLIPAAAAHPQQIDRAREGVDLNGALKRLRHEAGDDADLVEKIQTVRIRVFREVLDLDVTPDPYAPRGEQ